MSVPSETVMAARRRRAPIVVIVALDLGLAIAGATMLAKGLAKPSVRVVPVDAGIVTETASPTRDAEPAPAPPSEPTVDAAPAPPPVPSPSPPPRQRPPRATAASTVPRKAARPTAGSSVSKPSRGAAGADAGPPPLAPDASQPPDARSLASEIELATSRTRPQFDTCYFNAGGASAVRGVITIAFQVSPDGRAAHVTAVVNTTGSTGLAACLVTEITRWRFASRPTNAASFTRTFNYG